ncbi:hypothetical protein HPP92_015043 [Vanilla planifolia]|uniref:Uncharacterized protein n=1 Tax=Vanilla planifolia TaxID=51239 RepID=A0A835UVC1_VANPL|nr:hypothetical protein HPP92_015043 [Vanilla planifolia]
MKFDAEKSHDHCEFGIKDKGECGKHILAHMIKVDEEHEREDMLDCGSNNKQKGAEVVDQSQHPTDSGASCFLVNLDPLSCRNNECGCTEAPSVDAISENMSIAKEDLPYRDKTIIEVEMPHSLLSTGNGVCPSLKDICIDEMPQSFDKESNFDQQISSSMNLPGPYICTASVQESSIVARNDDVKKPIETNEGLSSLINTLEDHEQKISVTEDKQRFMSDSTNKVRNFTGQQSASKPIFDLQQLDPIGSIGSKIYIKEISEKQALSFQELDTASITQDLSDIPDSKIEYQHARLMLEQEEKTEKLFAAIADIDLQRTDMANVASDEAKLHGVAFTADLDTEEGSNGCIKKKMDVNKQEKLLARKDARTEELILHDITSPCSSFSNLSYVESSMYHAAVFSAPIMNSGHIPYSGNISLRSESSTTSARSFAFPILQSEWNSSPVKMVKADRKQLRKVRGWKMTLACCKF